MNNKRFDVIVVGELNVDLILNSIDSFPEMGKEKIALYRGQQVIKRSVNADKAVDELIELIISRI